MIDGAQPKLTPLTSYQKRLFGFLSVATFFEGYDFLALSQVLPEICEALDLTDAEAGALVGFINLGTIAAFFLVRYADRWLDRSLNRTMHRSIDRLTVRSIARSLRRRSPQNCHPRQNRGIHMNLNCLVTAKKCNATESLRASTN